MPVPRPRFHVSDPTEFINDPNGLVFWDGLAHAFYQRGHTKSWGHASSHDLLHWRVHEPKILPDAHGEIWSGSCFADRSNLSGLFPEAGNGLIAAFTYRTEARQAQGLAASEGPEIAFRKLSENPVLEDPTRPDFRDPKLFRHEDAWHLVLAAGHCLAFYRSENLRDWQLCGELAQPPGRESVIWECPDLFPIRQQPGRWCLVVSELDLTAFQPGAGREQYPTVWYTVGGLNNGVFQPQQEFRKVSHGPDEYATITFANAPAHFAMGWLSNWVYASAVPSMPGQNQLSLVRQWHFEEDARGLRLRQTLDHLAHHLVPTPEPVDSLFRIQAPLGAERITLHAESGHSLDLTVAGNLLRVDRSQADATGIGERFAGVFEVEAELESTAIEVWADGPCIEVLLANGQLYAPFLAYADGPWSRLEVQGSADQRAELQISAVLPGSRAT